jgi:hypothetical protein
MYPRLFRALNLAALVAAISLSACLGDPKPAGINDDDVSGAIGGSSPCGAFF